MALTAGVLAATALPSLAATLEVDANKRVGNITSAQAGDGGNVAADCSSELFTSEVDRDLWHFLVNDQKVRTTTGSGRNRVTVEYTLTADVTAAVLEWSDGTRERYTNTSGFGTQENHIWVLTPAHRTLTAAWLEYDVLRVDAGGTTPATETYISANHNLSHSCAAVMKDQEIDFTQPADVYADEGPVTVGATASSGLPVTLVSQTPAVCTVNVGGSIELHNPGTCTLTASQYGNKEYNPAQDVSRSFLVLEIPPPPTTTTTVPETTTTTVPETTTTTVPETTTTTVPETTTTTVPETTTTTVPETTTTTVPETTTTTVPETTTTTVPKTTTTTVAGAGGGGAPSTTTVPTELRMLETTEATKPGVFDMSAIPETAVVKPLSTPETIRGLDSMRMRDGMMEVVADKGFSGIIRIPLQMEHDGQVTLMYATVVVRPVPPVAVYETEDGQTDRNAPTIVAKPQVNAEGEKLVWLDSPRAVSFGKVTWTPSENAIGYEVWYRRQTNTTPLSRLDNADAPVLLCRTTGTTCEVPNLLGPKSRVEVVALGNDDTRSSTVLSAYKPEAAVPVLRVQFAADSPALSQTARRELDLLALEMKREGFNAVFAAGNISSDRRTSFGVWLGKERARIVGEYLTSRLGYEVRVLIKNNVGSVKVHANDSTLKSENRRVEVWVAGGGTDHHEDGYKHASSRWKAPPEGSPAPAWVRQSFD